MTQFVLFLDDAGAEFTKARTTRKEIVTLERGKLVRVKPVAIRPLEVIDGKGGAKRAAGGYLLLGPLGAAIGVLTGKGPTVLFEFELPDGSSRKGVIEQESYPELRRDIESMQTYRSGDLSSACLQIGSFLFLLVLFTASIGPAGLVVGPLLWAGGNYALAE